MLPIVAAINTPCTNKCPWHIRQGLFFVFYSEKKALSDDLLQIP